jgi:hypothetical protein
MLKLLPLTAAECASSTSETTSENQRKSKIPHPATGGQTARIPGITRFSIPVHIGALADVKRAIPAAKLLEVTPDFVGLTDIAELVGVSRQNMRKLALAHKESFPAAVHEGSATLWHLSPVLKWLGESANYSIKQSLLDVAHIAMQINLAKEASQIERQVQRELLELVA